MNKFDDLVLEYPPLAGVQMKSLKGGDQADDWAWQVNLPEYTVTPNGGNGWYNDPGWYNNTDPNYTPYSTYDGGNDNGGWSWGNPTAQAPSVTDQVAFAFSHAGIWTDVYDVAAGQKTLSSVVTEVFSNPFTAVSRDLQALSGEFKGIAVLSLAGKALRIVSAGQSLNTLWQDMNDGDGKINPLNVADAVISVGSLAVKSSVVGFAVSTGWLLIKGEFE